MVKSTKEMIAEAARHLIVDKRIKKLTVTDIVEECQITRQTFYYHFENIPEMFRWAMEKESKRIIEDVKNNNYDLSILREFFLLASGAKSVIIEGLSSNYYYEIEKVFSDSLYSLFKAFFEENDLLKDYKASERRFIIRYHTGAIIDILKKWSEKDSEKVDMIVELTMKIMSGQIKYH